jgi:ribose/xylose/arabinose/galactoside ABC-type transport system permease subunit
MNDIKNRTGTARNILLSEGFYILLAIVIIIFTIISEPFFTIRNWQQISIDASFYLAAGIGMTLCMITGNIDLSVGSVAFLVAAFLGTTTLPMWSAMIIALLIGLTIGLINGLLVSRFKMNSVLTTLGFMIAYRGIGLVLTQGSHQTVSDPAVKQFGEIKLLGFPILFVIGLALMIIFQIVLGYTKFGRHCYAIGNDELSAMKVGIPLNLVKTMVFVISGFTAAITGILYILFLGEVSSWTGKGMEFTVAATVVIGGTSLFGGRGTILPGTLLGVLLLTIIKNGLGTMGISFYVYPFVSGFVIFLAMYVDSLKNFRRKVRFE